MKGPELVLSCMAQQLELYYPLLPKVDTEEPERGLAYEATRPAGEM